MKRTERLKEFKAQLLENETYAEKSARWLLKGWGFHLKKQQILCKKYIADFYIPEIKLVIEIDGSSHDGKEEYDERRANEILSMGGNWTVLRYTNDLVINYRETFKQQLREDLGLPSGVCKPARALVPKWISPRKKRRLLRLQSQMNCVLDQTPNES